MTEETHKLLDVFGVAREIPKNYVARQSVDAAFVDSLGRDKHIVIYGSSKQGKTCLRKFNLPDQDFISVHCSNKWNLKELHANILKRAGFELTVSTTETVSGGKKLTAKFGAKLFGIVDAGIEGGNEDSTATQVQSGPLELDGEDVNDVIAALHSINFKRFIVLEDFHYLPIETQRHFSVALKAFHENSKLTFVIIGVWLDENRLSVYNGDLAGRITSINADEWKETELLEVIETGEALLNIAFPTGFKTDLIKLSQGSVSVTQEACYAACNQARIFSTCEEHKKVPIRQDVPTIVRDVVDQHRGRYNSFLTQFAIGFQSTQLELYRWLLLPVIMASADDFTQGIRLRRIRQWLHANHPERENVNPGSITQALQYVSSLQITKEIKPIVLDYDETNLRLNVVDRGFLIWLGHQNRSELLDSLSLPRDPSIPLV